jgi:hypothetical protein
MSDAVVHLPSGWRSFRAPGSASGAHLGWPDHDSAAHHSRAIRRTGIRQQLEVLVIDDRERVTLDELERQLRLYDPRYLEAFDGESDSMPAHRRARLASPAYPFLLTLIGAVALLVTMGWFAEATIVALVAALAWQVRRRRRRSPDGRRRLGSSPTPSAVQP